MIKSPTNLSHSIMGEIKNNLSLSLPLMLAWIIYSLGPFAGTAMIARLGDDMLAASILVGTIWIAGFTFCIGIFHSISILIAHQRGANNPKAVGKIMGQAFLLNLLLWVPLFILMRSVPYLVKWSAPNPEILIQATAYAHSLSYCIPGFLTLAMLEEFLNGVGKTKISLLVSLIEIPIEIGFIYIFVFGKFGVPAYGIAGVGYGLTLSFALTAILLGVALKFAKFTYIYEIYNHIGKFDLHYCKEMLRIGTPIGFSYFTEVVTFILATYFISRFSTIALAAHQIIMQFLGVLINVPYALTQAISIRVGLNVGNLDKSGVYYAAYVGIGIGILLSLIILSILIISPMWLLSIDLNVDEIQNQSLVNLSVSLFFILGIYQLLDSIRILEAGALRGLKDTKIPMLINIVCFFFFGLAAAFIIGILLNGNVLGVWYGLTFGMGLGAVFLMWRLHKKLSQMDLRKIVKIKEWHEIAD